MEVEIKITMSVASGSGLNELKSKAQAFVRDIAYLAPSPESGIGLHIKTDTIWITSPQSISEA